ncbi:SIDT2 protein, partial [Chloropsis hardwickii]|nr:SIDT2 protein [Chloropsis hardwickii]
MSGAGAAVLAWALLAGALLPPPPVRPQPLPHGDREVHEKEAQFNTTYSDWVHANLLNIYAFNHSVRRNRTEGVRVSVNVLSDQKDQPVLFVVRQKEAVVSFQVPLILRGLYQRKYAYQEVSRTLCQPQTKAEVETQHFYVDVSTLSLNTSYQLRVTRVENFVLRTNERFSFNATAAQPQVRAAGTAWHGRGLRPGGEGGRRGSHGLFVPAVLQKKDFPSHSFYVVVVVKTEDEACGGALPYYPLSKDASPDEPVDQHNRQKMLEVMVSPAITSEAYVRSVLFCLGIFLSFYILTLLIACWESCRQHKRKGLLAAMDSPSLDTGHSRSIPDSFLNHGPYDSYGYGSFGNGSSSSTEGITDSLASAEVSYSYVGEWLGHWCGHSPVESCAQWHPGSVPSISGQGPGAAGPSVQPPAGFPSVTHLRELCFSNSGFPLKGRSTLGAAVPNCAPQRDGDTPGSPLCPSPCWCPQVVNVTGNQDICYYNFLCAHPLGNLSAFNNILSNLGYILLGLLFLLIILQREINYNRALLRNDAHALECGIPKHFGLFYAMGTALMMEGLLSACYHVCPNYTNFQFDTSFMYMIAGLCMLKLYQKRHPDINASAYSAYACLALVIFFSVVGVVFGKGNTAFWIVFSVIHIVATLLLSTQLYYMGRWKLGEGWHRERGGWGHCGGPPGVTSPLPTDSGILRRILHVLYTDCVRQCSGPMYVDRMVLLVMGNIINWSLAAYGLIVRPNDFASYLLAIGICNLLLYFAFYIIMKLRSGERIKLIPLLCIISTSVVWGFALFFFFQGLSTWQKTPAESREHNRDCILLDFFDDHDIWHFLSSIAMFGSFLVLLTLDDDLDCVQRDKIYVF